ncbi:MAG: 2-hydroxyglutaryl-CoA dehydratase [Oscillospiraceae bacterium]|nr:2-hydroxyglutaryl-CoA dehydratase [Oscillospiraceae bacterium]
MLTLGIDIGSTTAKCAVLEDGREFRALTLRDSGIGTDGPQAALKDALTGLGISRGDVDCVCATGYGRAAWQDADLRASELTCHCLGGVYVFPGLRTLIDIVGQDAKVISIDADGNMAEFVMNDKCAEGTGRFLDVMAALLHRPVDSFAEAAARSKSPASISNTCTVFAESEVISQLAAGVAAEDVVAGICRSVASRVGSLARRLDVRQPVCMSGGVAKNAAVREALSEYLQVPILYDERAQLFGAMGAAIYAARKQSKE